MIHLLPPDGGDHLSFIGHSFFAKKSARLGPRIIRDGFQTNRTYTGGEVLSRVNDVPLWGGAL